VATWVDCLLVQKPRMWIADDTFQLMHMSHDNHAVWVRWAMVARKKTKKNHPSAYSFTTRVFWR